MYFVPVLVDSRLSGLYVHGLADNVCFEAWAVQMIDEAVAGDTSCNTSLCFFICLSASFCYSFAHSSNIYGG